MKPLCQHNGLSFCTRCGPCTTTRSFSSSSVPSRFPQVPVLSRDGLCCLCCLLAAGEGFEPPRGVPAKALPLGGF